MTTQPEALRLADWCEANSSGVYRTSAEAADELRRLHAECEVLRMERDALRAATGGRMGYFYDEVGKLHAEREALLATQSDTLLRLLCDLRFALGDNGARMQHDLVEYARALRADAERYRLLCEVHGPSTELCFDGRSYRGKAEFDAAIDAYRAAKEQQG